MNRRNWMRNITMAIAASLVPRILQPSMGEVEEDDLLLPKYSSVFVDLEPVGYDDMTKMMEKYGKEDWAKQYFHYGSSLNMG